MDANILESLAHQIKKIAADAVTEGLAPLDASAKEFQKALQEALAAQATSFEKAMMNQQAVSDKRYNEMCAKMDVMHDMHKAAMDGFHKRIAVQEGRDFQPTVQAAPAAVNNLVQTPKVQVDVHHTTPDTAPKEMEAQVLRDKDGRMERFRIIQR